MTEMKPIDVILASPLENITESFKKMGLGELKSFTNVFRMMYQTQDATKDKLLERIEKGELKIDDPEVKNTLDGLYGMMTKIESIVLIGQEVEKSKVISE